MTCRSGIHSRCHASSSGMGFEFRITVGDDFRGVRCDSCTLGCLSQPPFWGYRMEEVGIWQSKRDDAVFFDAENTPG